MFISISHQIRSRADKSTSWHITSSLWRKPTRAGNPKRQGGGGEDEKVKLYLTERKREAGWRQREWRGKQRWRQKKKSVKREKGETYIFVAQIHSAVWGEEEEEEEEAERRETKRWRDTKNSITGLALTLTFIQQGDTPSLSQLLFTAVTGEACPTLTVKFDSTMDHAEISRWGDIFINPCLTKSVAYTKDYVCVCVVCVGTIQLIVFISNPWLEITTAATLITLLTIS